MNFVRKNDQLYGPFSESQIRSGLKSGKLALGDEIAESKEGPWLRLSDHPAFQTQASTPSAHSNDLGLDDLENFSTPNSENVSKLRAVDYSRFTNNRGAQASPQAVEQPAATPAENKKGRMFLIVGLSSFGVLVLLGSCVCGGILFGPGFLDSMQESAEFSDARKLLVEYSKLEGMQFDHGNSTAGVLFFDENDPFRGKHRGNEEALEIVSEIERLHLAWPEDKIKRLREYIRSDVRNHEITQNAAWMIDGEDMIDTQSHIKARRRKHEKDANYMKE